jgi:hypothetical protein
MTNYSEIESLEEQLDEFIKDSKKIIGYKIGSVKEIIKALQLINTPKSIQLSKDILDTQIELDNLLNYNEPNEENNPFLSLYNEDDEL